MTLYHRLKQIGGVLAFQGLAFVITFSTNIFIIRTLPKASYAVFIICFQMLGVVSILTDSGITPAFRRLAGQFWKTKHFFSPLVKSLLELRNKLMVGIIPISLVIAAVLFYRQNGFTWRILPWVTLLSVLVFLEIQKAMHLEILRSQLQVRKVQLVENLLNFSRFVLGLASLLLMNIEFLLFAYILASWIASAFAKAKAKPFFNPADTAKNSYKKVMMSKYRELLPNSIFFIIQSQVAIFLLTFFHRAGGVADYGALGRITVIFNMLNAVVLNVFAINFSRNQNLNSLRKNYFTILGSVILLSLVLFCSIFLFRHQIVSILGKKYRGLEYLLIQLTFNSCVTFVLSSVGMLNNAKAWVFYNARFAIPVSIFALVLGMFILDFSKIENIILYSLMPIAFTGLLKLADSFRGLKLAFYK